MQAAGIPMESLQIYLSLQDKRFMSTRNSESEERWNDRFRCRGRSKNAGGEDFYRLVFE